MSTQPPDLHDTSPSGPGDVNHIRRVLKIWAVMSVIGVAIVIALAGVVNSASGSSDQAFANLTNVLFTAMGVVVGLFVWVFVGYSLVVFRERAAVDVDGLEDGPPLQAKPSLQIWWLAITSALAIFLVGWGLFGFYKQTTDPPRDPLVVQVIGQQWMWTYSYPSLGVQSNLLELPIGRPVQFRVISEDVLHGFVVNGLAVAMDANPGWWTTAPIVTPNRLGNYTTRCVELCGLYHTFMWSQVKVVSAADFSTWVAANSPGASAAS